MRQCGHTDRFRQLVSVRPGYGPVRISTAMRLGTGIFVPGPLGPHSSPVGYQGRTRAEPMTGSSTLGEQPDGCRELACVGGLVEEIVGPRDGTGFPVLRQ